MRKAIPLFRFATLKRARNGPTRATNIVLNSQAEGAADSVDSPSRAEDLLRCPAKKIDPPLLFPWRHTSDLPPRLVERQKKYSYNWMSYDTSTFGISALTARMYLGVPFTRLLGESWKRELAESCSWAFAQGVAGILSNVYEVPFDKIASNNDDDVSLEFNSTYLNEDSQNGNSTPDDTPSEETMAMESIMETKLRNLYSSAHESGRNQLEVYLASKPTGAHLHSLHALPGLSRSLAENHPDILADIEKEKSRSRDASYLDRILVKTGQIETTLFAEVLVDCDESFRVRNLESGATIQGYNDGKVRQVVHGVRLERVMRWAPGEGKQASNWCITDIDDLLDGNRWFSPPGVQWYHDG